MLFAITVLVVLVLRMPVTCSTNVTLVDADGTSRLLAVVVLPTVLPEMVFVPAVT